MNADSFAEWLLSSGYKVLKTASSYWVMQGPGTYQAFPYHWVIRPSDDELTALMRDNHALGLRYSTPLEAIEGAYSYHVVMTYKEYEMQFLPKKCRHDVQRGLELYHFEPISFEMLAGDGWTLREETLKRQGRAGAETQSWWKRLWAGADRFQGLETWGAVSRQNQLAACLITFTCDDCVSILYHQSRTEHLSNGVNNALTFTLTQKNIRAGKWMFYGLHSLDAPCSVDEFKLRMGYTIKPLRQRAVFHPKLAFLINPISHSLVKYMRCLYPSKTIFAKADGLLRFYLNGKLLLEQQPVPDLLRRSLSSRR